MLCRVQHRVVTGTHSVLPVHRAPLHDHMQTIRAGAGAIFGPCWLLACWCRTLLALHAACAAAHAAARNVLR